MGSSSVFSFFFLSVVLLVLEDLLLHFCFGLFFFLKNNLKFGGERGRNLERLGKWKTVIKIYLN